MLPRCVSAADFGLEFERLDLFPRIRLHDHPPDRGDIGRCVLGVEIAPCHLLGAREFAFEGQDESEILAHRFVGVVLRRRVLQRLFGLRQFFRKRVGKSEIGQNMRLSRHDFERRRIVGLRLLVVAELIGDRPLRGKH